MEKSITLLDGGMGQELIRRSGAAPTPLWSTRVMLDNPELAETLHVDFIKAGAKVIALNNYTATLDHPRGCRFGNCGAGGRSHNARKLYFG